MKIFKILSFLTLITGVFCYWAVQDLVGVLDAETGVHQKTIVEEILQEKGEGELLMRLLSSLDEEPETVENLIPWMEQVQQEVSPQRLCEILGCSKNPLIAFHYRSFRDRSEFLLDFLKQNKNLSYQTAVVRFFLFYTKLMREVGGSLIDEMIAVSNYNKLVAKVYEITKQEDLSLSTQSVSMIEELFRDITEFPEILKGERENFVWVLKLLKEKSLAGYTMMYLFQGDPLTAYDETMEFAKNSRNEDSAIVEKILDAPVLVQVAVPNVRMAEKNIMK